VLRGNTINNTKDANKASSRVIDGFIKGPSRAAANGTSHHPKNPAHQLHKRTDKAQTLMRGALKKPSAGFSSKMQRLAPGFNPQREIRAKTIALHSRVNRFGSPAVSPAIQPPIIQGEVVPRRGHSLSAAAASTSVALPSMVASVSHQKLERMLDEALTKANSHKQALRYQAARHFWQRPGFLGRWRGLKLLVALVIVLLIAGFVAWRELPQLSVRLAAARTHVEASVPSYKPTGYNLISPAAAQNGAVLLKYKAADSSQSFDISQKSSNMTSVSLAQTIVPAGSQIQTSQVAGNTVYIYGQNNDAAWVNNGVLYTISNHAKLSSDEIIKIVQGLN